MDVLGIYLYTNLCICCSDYCICCSD